VSSSPLRSLRLFVAIELPDAQRQALARLQDSMKAAVARRFGDSTRVRWTRPESTHITLKFLGATPPDRLESVVNALASAVPDSPMFNLSLANAGSFAGRRPPQVIIAGVSGQTKPLLELVERIDTALAVAGWPREKRDFRAHITLARLPQDLSNETRRAIAETASRVKLDSRHTWPVAHVSLMQSHLGREGAHYERIARFPA
jgi:RNA 2',3'-cyclic 3'-phosphodiesterase